MALALEWRPLFLSLELAAVSTLVLLVLGTPLAWWLATTRARLRPVVAALVALPLVLPPTVLGFYLLVLLGPHGPGGRLMAALGGPRLVFSFPGLVIGSVVFSLPFVVQPLRTAFVAIGRRPLEVAATLRAGRLDRFWTVVVPLAAPAFVVAACLAFAHTVGEFGVVLMLGGNLAGETRVASIAVNEAVEQLRYGDAHALAAVLLGFAFAVMLVVHAFDRDPERSDRSGGRGRAAG